MTLLLADDHAMFRESLRVLLEREGFAIAVEATNGLEAVRLAREHHPTIAVLDIGMPFLNGIDAARQMHKRVPDCAVIVLTMFEDDMHVLAALRAGVRGYVLKAQAASDLVAAIREVERGAVYLSPGISHTLVEHWLKHTDAGGDPLTERERQVLQLVAEGKSLREIAGILSISAKTADSHRTRMMNKLDLHNTAALVRYAVRSGLVQA
ncbi:MAG: response regulator transcription factor [Gammaproteobacteria bacterium]|nr:MAG: response regulator transcription factor [Gammaproteobacteria bacterium]